MHRNLIVAENFNLTNVNELFDTLADLGSTLKRGQIQYCHGKNWTFFR